MNTDAMNTGAAGGTQYTQPIQLESSEAKIQVQDGFIKMTHPDGSERIFRARVGGEIVRDPATLEKIVEMIKTKFGEAEVVNATCNPITNDHKVKLMVSGDKMVIKHGKGDLATRQELTAKNIDQTAPRIFQGMFQATRQSTQPESPTTTTQPQLHTPTPPTSRSPRQPTIDLNDDESPQPSSLSSTIQNAATSDDTLTTLANSTILANSTNSDETTHPNQFETATSSPLQSDTLFVSLSQPPPDQSKPITTDAQTSQSTTSPTPSTPPNTSSTTSPDELEQPSTEDENSTIPTDHTSLEEEIEPVVDQKPTEVAAQPQKTVLTPPPSLSTPSLTTTPNSVQQKAPTSSLWKEDQRCLQIASTQNARGFGSNTLLRKYDDPVEKTKEGFDAGMKEIARSLLKFGQAGLQLTTSQKEAVQKSADHLQAVSDLRATLTNPELQLSQFYASDSPNKSGRTSKLATENSDHRIVDDFNPQELTEAQKTALENAKQQLLEIQRDFNDKIINNTATDSVSQSLAGILDLNVKRMLREIQFLLGEINRDAYRL